MRANDRRIDVAHSRHRICLRFERAFDHCNQTARAARQCEIDRISGAPADRLAGHEFSVAVEKDGARLGLRVDINSDRLAVVMGPVLDFKRAAAHAQGGISAENENARRRASAVLPRRELFLAALEGPVAGLHELLARIERERLPRVGTRRLRSVFAPGIMQDGGLSRRLGVADQFGDAVVGDGIVYGWHRWSSLTGLSLTNPLVANHKWDQGLRDPPTRGPIPSRHS